MRKRYNDKLNYIVPPKPYKKGPIARCTTDKLAMGPFYRFFPIKRVYYLYYIILYRNRFLAL